ncbi:hypothetical protein KBB89_03545 [Candidatus Gracilibacteria bacterium]|nr:hypothetical protein [Candidatus Gracilibacteria bacterium]
MVKKNRHILRYFLYGIIALLCLTGGILYSRIQKKGVAGVVNSELGSQVINQITNRETQAMSPEKIQKRIDQLEGEILEATNDPDRALQLRREVQNLRNQLKTASEIQ